MAIAFNIFMEQMPTDRPWGSSHSAAIDRLAAVKGKQKRESTFYYYYYTNGICTNTNHCVRYQKKKKKKEGMRCTKHLTR